MHLRAKNQAHYLELYRRQPAVRPHMHAMLQVPAFLSFHNMGRTVDSKESHVLPAVRLAYNALQTTMHHDLPHNSLMPDHSHPSKNFQQFASRYHYGYQYMVEISYSHLILSDLLCQCKTSAYLIRYG